MMRRACAPAASARGATAARDAMSEAAEETKSEVESFQEQMQKQMCDFMFVFYCFQQVLKAIKIPPQ